MRFKLLTILFLGNFLFSQEELSYQKPSLEILKLADYERAPSVMMDNKKECMVFMYRPTYKSLEELNEQDLRLGGLRINPKTNIASTITYSNNIKIKRRGDKLEKQVLGLPQNPKITNLDFSPDDTKLAFTNTTSNGVELWIVDLSTNTAKKLTSDNLNANFGIPYAWYKDSKSLLVRSIPAQRPALIKKENNIPTGPIVSNSDGKVSQTRTYQDLLQNPMDEANFETIATSELVKVSISGTQTLYKSAAMYIGNSFSPDGNYVMLTTLAKPFSYIVPYSRFPMISKVYDLNGQEIKEVNNIPLIEVMPKGFSSVRTGKRNMAWRRDEPATLYYVEALDGGDQAKEAEYRDEVLLWKAPFNSNPEPLFKLKNRFSRIYWTTDHYAIVSENWYDTRNEKTHILDLKTKTSKLFQDRNWQDVYSDPGIFQMDKNHLGEYVVKFNNKKAYLVGKGFTKEGQFPFIDELDIASLNKKRLFTSKQKNIKEDLIDFIDVSKGEVLVSQESKNQYPNYYVRNIKTNKLTSLTQFSNPFESIKDVYKELITYKRNDGVELSGTLYLPSGYDFKNKPKLPLLVWAYPTEYKDKNTAGQVTANPNEFTFPYYGSFVYWVAKGYAVLDDASFPIIGEGKTEPNDTFIPQLVANAQAAIDAVDKLGYIDRKKVAVGGHSYGAFMTANLLTHSDLFACGIARSGAYNRTLTPFGFQSEQRNYWDVPEVYNTISPFMSANKMKTPMLLVHGEADNNPGTFTLQTERYFQALKNLGAPVRMVILPKESHGYVAKENIFHLLWEQDQFLEKCLKK